MSVQELINKLNSIEDKSKEVVLCYSYGVTESCEPLGLEDITEAMDCVIIG